MIGNFLPKLELCTGFAGFASDWTEDRHPSRGKEAQMKMASIVINLGFGLGLALGAVVLLIL